MNTESLVGMQRRIFFGCWVVWKLLLRLSRAATRNPNHFFLDWYCRVKHQFAAATYYRTELVFIRLSFGTKVMCVVPTRVARKSIQRWLIVIDEPMLVYCHALGYVLIDWHYQSGGSVFSRFIK